MNVTWSKEFAKDLKYYYRKKKYLKIREDVEKITDELEKGNLIGVKIEGLQLKEGAAYKVRVENSSANVGKSNGFRIIYYYAIEDEIYLLTIYSKKDDERIPNDAQILLMIKNILDVE